MGCLSTTRITEITNQTNRLIAQYNVLQTAITNGTLHVESYTLDTGEARQTMKYKSLKEMFDLQELLYSQIERNRRLLRGTGLMNLNLRRYI